MGLILKLRHCAIPPDYLRTFELLFGSLWGCPNCPKMNKTQHKNLFSGCFGQFLLKNGPNDWLGFFLAQTLGLTSCSLADLRVPFWVHLGVPKWPQNEK
jgi:hypothetical protein